MKPKVLSLCFPTYNRGWCIKKQIEQLINCPKEILDKIEIIISDNCSTDDTQNIVEDAIANGFNCKYMRNETNIGMDGNFVRCCRMVHGRYLWILGDDDIITLKSLVQIVNLLDVTEDYGLLHIYQKNGLYDKIIYVNNKEEMIKSVSYFITFISANIVNARYISYVKFEDYMGTWFVLVPLYLIALKQENINIIFSRTCFDAGKDNKNNGGYNYFNVFVRNYLSIINEYISDEKLISWLKRDIWPHLWTYTRMLLIKKNTFNYSLKNGWYILLRNYGNEYYFWKTLMLYPFKVLINKIRNFKNIKKII